jgi:hypothetical protein
MAAMPQRDVEVRDTIDRGRGVFARRSFAPGEFILRRRRQRLDDRILEPLPPTDRPHVCQVDLRSFALVLGPGAGS